MDWWGFGEDGWQFNWALGFEGVSVRCKTGFQIPPPRAVAVAAW
jgi:hypothetical protein